MKVLKIISILTTALVSFASAQIGFSVDAESGYASNIFANYRQLADYYQDFQGYINYDFLSETQGLRTFYQGSAMLFEKYDYRSYSQHRAGFNYYKNFQSTKLSAGLSGNMRLHSDDYKWYEYKQGYAFINLKAMLWPQLFGYIGSNIRVRNYDELSPYSYWQNVNFIRLSKSFNSGTSIIGEFDFLQKKYLAEKADPILTFSALQTEGDGQSQQVVGLLRIGQAVSPTTGLSAQALVRKSLKSSVRYLINDEGFYYSDEELFDDPYGYDAQQLGVTLKQKLPWKMQLSLGATFLHKNYINRLALDLEGYPFEDERMRDDTRSVGWLSLSKSWKYNRSMAPIQFTIDISTMKNASNDPYYDFNTTYFSFGLSQDF